MALYYDLKPLYVRYRDDEAFVRDHLITFCKDGRKVLKKVKIAIADKEHLKVERLLLKIRPYLEFLGMDLAVEELDAILLWATAEGKKKEVKEIFKAFKFHMKNGIKELEKDFSLV